MTNCSYVPKSKMENLSKRKDKREKEKKAGKKEEEYEKLELNLSENEVEVNEEEMKAFDSKAEKAKFKKAKRKYQADTNVIQIDLNTINQAVKVSTGDPLKCKICGTYLNKFSIIKPIEGKKEKEWTCEFCGNYNEVAIENEELPKEDSSTYILEKLVLEEKKSDKIADPIIVFCIDISGSMDRIDKSSKVSASRLDCLKINIQQQLTELKGSIPKAKVGFVTFENKVKILGNSTSSASYELEESSFDNFLNMIERCVGKSDLISAPISESFERLSVQLASIKTGGSTALGPGLTAAISLASRGSVGSKVILCTDGKANKGIGKVESKVQTVLAQTEEFYVQLGNYAKEKGIVVTLVSLVSDDCKLEMLSPVANITGGDIVKVNPSMLDKDFKQFMSEKVFASNVKIIVRLHKSMEFKNVSEGKVIDNLLHIDVGNATETSKRSFEYKFRGSEELSKMEINLAAMDKTYFQTTIFYTTSDNFKCIKIITMMHQITHEKEKAEAEINTDVLKEHAKFTTAKIAEEGDYEEAMSHAVLWDKMAKGKGVKEDVKNLYSAMSAQQAVSAPVRGSYKMAVYDEVTCEINKAKKSKK